jgi:hypothetical protein
MENYFYYYKVRFYVDCVEQIADGFTFGKSWTEVISNLANYYGEDEMVEILNLRILGDGGTCIEVEDINEDLMKIGIKVKKVEKDDEKK